MKNTREEATERKKGIFLPLVYEEKQSIMLGMAANIHLALFLECGYLAHFLLFI